MTGAEDDGAYFFGLDPVLKEEDRIVDWVSLPFQICEAITKSPKDRIFPQPNGGFRRLNAFIRGHVVEIRYCLLPVDPLI